MIDKSNPYTRSLGKLNKNGSKQDMRSSFSKKDFRNPFHRTGTFGAALLDKRSSKYSSKHYDHNLSVEFRGTDAPPVGSYDPVPVYGNIGMKPVLESKVSRETRGNIFVNKYKLSIPYVAPNTYQRVDLMTDFKKKTGYFGSRAARNTDVRMYAQQNHKQVQRGIF